MPKPRLILASSSPRRKELLQEHFRLRIIKPNIDEDVRPKEKPLAYVRRVAKEKWQAVSQSLQSSDWVLACDTTVIFQGVILGKASSQREATCFMKKLAGREHEVISAVCLSRADSTPRVFHSRTLIGFRDLSEGEIRSFVRSGEWKGKAGAYGIQGRASQFVSSIRGSLTNVIGLPLEKVLSKLESEQD